jgi:hypothetical protein
LSGSKAEPNKNERQLLGGVVWQLVEEHVNTARTSQFAKVRNC